MEHSKIDPWSQLKTVEPVRRMVGGRFGWAYHRFPIKGGITPAKAAAVTWAEALSRAAAKPSFFHRIT